MDIATSRPAWIRVKRLDDGVRARIAASVGATATVCQSANCPNIGECWARGTATYMLMGGTCTRNCAFCDVPFGRPEPLDPAEPARIADSAAGLGLKYVVMTCVDRDDLPDSGAAHWVAVIEALREQRGELVLANQTLNIDPVAAAPCRRDGAGIDDAAKDGGKVPPPRGGEYSAPTFAALHLAGTGIEILTGDFKGDEDAIASVARARPDVFAHNVETVPRLQRVARHKATWERSLRVLKVARENSGAGLQTRDALAGLKTHPTSNTPMFIKSGMMLGLGESDAEVREAMHLLREGGVELLTLGQYLKPRNVAGKLELARWVTPNEFSALAEYARGIGFAGVAASPLTRSSYLAETLYARAYSAR